MPTKEDLLLEKRRYGLPQTISSFELQQLKQGMPVQKIMGYVDMHNVRIYLQHKVLIPRYETEELILLVEQYYKDANNIDVLDMCTGSGFIAIALKHENKTWNITASDIDLEAINQCNINAKENNVYINIIQSDLFQNINQKFDVIVSNPPYIQESEHLADSVINYEPLHALYAPEDGFYFYDAIIKHAPKYLKVNGTLFFEINPFHKKYWDELSKTYNIKIYKDMSNKDRFAVVKFDDLANKKD
ncbi:peptide chain release factor N(5)-glutamine methyltransferase [Mycoplasmopsis verecunda]|uniref:peptide chain release factor N(5)-glutamine methyltransferase n=1 Tax=Mycoplasmopsis verecunda TaxID=171291 RepID=A0A1T4M7S6_9BACT|nr:peptide chain release factor N(5)-glutamine methyltransferase [Mycoplasmopsis verecunda]WPB54797.1 peptide chain release factor N(5)-glutamine methyltransferase [Mycoplasmopsis verecunda]SJZ62896.1 release factor glutamine methyltransferase [Mycoplasmopsis verecunda]